MSWLNYMAKRGWIPPLRGKRKASSEDGRVSVALDRRNIVEDSGNCSGIEMSGKIIGRRVNTVDAILGMH